MKNEKQIEEMAIAIANYDGSIICELGDCKGCSYNNFGRKCIWLRQAEALYNAGYRKVDNGCTIKMQGESELSKVFNEFLEEYTYVKQRQGEWEQHGLSNPKRSLCGKYNIEKANYCPHCGAKMKGAE